MDTTATSTHKKSDGPTLTYSIIQPHVTSQPHGDFSIRIAAFDDYRRSEGVNGGHGTTTRGQGLGACERSDRRESLWHGRAGAPRSCCGNPPELLEG
ncbi:hypothetical protein E3N88_03355 [Mikania micrantha]|uniref:Uncharacterized protein n=1 Tax=Mikania micrantha TaxID=192012 RepID=A0A5N6Q6G1_9ASTR|nr:hypothetical protein E3N88_03355 [Mikania micrantha]